VQALPNTDFETAVHRNMEVAYCLCEN